MLFLPPFRPSPAVVKFNKEIGALQPPQPATTLIDAFSHTKNMCNNSKARFFGFMLLFLVFKSMRINSNIFVNGMRAAWLPPAGCAASRPLCVSRACRRGAGLRDRSAAPRQGQAGGGSRPPAAPQAPFPPHL